MEAPEISRKSNGWELHRFREREEEALDLMLGFLGRVTGNLALTLETQGEFILQVEFRQN